MCDNPTYKHAEGDQHNLWLAVKNINSNRSDNLYGEVERERRFAYCPEFEHTYSPDRVLVEPRNSVKGKNARSLFYMHDEYGLNQRYETYVKTLE